MTLLIPCVWLIYVFTGHSGFCTVNEPFFSKSLAGKVNTIINEYDSIKKRPMPQIIIVSALDTTSIFNTYMAFNFDFAKGDSISKEKNTFYFQVFRQDSLIYSTSQYYDCPCSYCK